MIYNLFISKWDAKYNVFGLNEQDLQKAINAYLNGDNSFTISGEKHYLNRLDTFKIFTFEKEDIQTSIQYYSNNVNFYKSTVHNKYLPIDTLKMMGNDVTSDFIGNKEYGSNITEMAAGYSNTATKKDIEEIHKRLDEVIEWLKKGDMGNEVIFNELQELREESNKLSLKNWQQLVKGKIIDLGMDEAAGIAKSQLKIMFQMLTGIDPSKLLN